MKKIIKRNPTQIFGTHLRDMMSYVGWLKSNQGINHLADTGGVHGLTVDFYHMVNKSHTFLSQSMEDFNEEGLNKLFKGKWNIQINYYYDRRKVAEIMYGGMVICEYDPKMTLNDFALHCKNLGIDLELN